MIGVSVHNICSCIAYLEVSARVDNTFSLRHNVSSSACALNFFFSLLFSPSSTRFLPLSQAYSKLLRRLAFRASHDLSLPATALAEGTYAWVSGPTYESPAEGRF